jgi:hypothetical protein
VVMRVIWATAVWQMWATFKISPYLDQVLDNAFTIYFNCIACYRVPRSKPKCVSRNIRKQWKEDTEKAIIAVRDKVGTEMILLYFYINYSFVHKFIFCYLHFSSFLLYFRKFLS